MTRWCAALAVAALLLAAAPAQAQRFTADDRETLLLSRAADGGFPDGPSRNGVFSYDRQFARFAAFESDATNIVAGDTNGQTDVFVVDRARPFDLGGQPWRLGRTRLVSRGAGGEPANGPSTGPDLGGDQVHRPRCVVFVSAASNLVRGDRNGRADAFIHDLRSGRTRLVSDGRGTVSEVAVDGSCGRVAYVSDAGGHKQVYVRVLSGGRPTVVSASPRGRSGNGDSTGLAFSKLGGAGGCKRSCGARVGEAIAYESTSTNLARGDRNRRSDVYVTSFSPRGRGLRRRTTLVSATASGRAGNRASSEPAIGDNGAYVAYRTEATDLLPGDANGVADIARANALDPGSNIWVSRSQAVGEPANGPSARPTITRSGSMVFFESDATNLQSTVREGGIAFDRNVSGDMFFWSWVSRNASLQSRDSKNEILNNGERYERDHRPHAPARNPAASYYGNYVAWESAYPLVDLGVAASAFPGLTPEDAAARSFTEPRLNQVYLRYIGPA